MSHGDWSRNRGNYMILSKWFAFLFRNPAPSNLIYSQLVMGFRDPIGPLGGGEGGSREEERDGKSRI